MSRQRSTTSSTSGRGSQSGGSSTRATSNKATTTDQELSGATSVGGGAQTGGSFSPPDAQGTGTMEKAQQLAGQVQQKATQRVESGLARGKTQAAETLNTLAESLITTGQQLRERNQEPVSRYVDQFADRVRRVSTYLQNTDVSEIVDSTEDFARRQPALFLGGAFALGLLGARFLKSSRRQVEARGQFASGGGAGTGQRRMREGITGIEQEVPTSRPQQEWAASGAQTSGLADVAGAGAQGDLLGGSSGFGRERRPLVFGATPPGGPEASQR
jgi:hypothetical protein